MRDPLLHDASVAGGTFADRVTTAIMAHGQVGSEARAAVDALDAMDAFGFDRLGGVAYRVAEALEEALIAQHSDGWLACVDRVEKCAIMFLCMQLKALING